ncbi:SDR family oxidoreductase [Lichenicoccus sp.]|uniref:SDR family oxidoreductase n=1 Tax=Lichenicoccus sp. TaxID=2781899 RepID=UPI003D0A784E
MSAPCCALVTGAAHGIGRAITCRLLSDGWRVFALDTDADGLASLPRDAAEALETIVGDVSTPAGVAAAMERIAARGDRLDALVSNAGIMIRKPIEHLSPEEWNRVVATNLTATFLLARAARACLAANDGSGDAGGAIVTIASTRAHMSEPDTESYAASKGGLLALTHALAVSLGPAIRVNCISPGWIDVAGEPLRPEDHAQHPAGRVGTAGDVAALAAWLLGPESRFVTGAEFIVDGGITRRMIYAE